MGYPIKRAFQSGQSNWLNLLKSFSVFFDAQKEIFQGDACLGFAGLVLISSSRHSCCPSPDILTYCFVDIEVTYLDVCAILKEMFHEGKQWNYRVNPELTVLTVPPQAVNMNAQQTPNPATYFTGHEGDISSDWLVWRDNWPDAQLPSADPPAVVQSAADLQRPDIVESDLRVQASC